MVRTIPHEYIPCQTKGHFAEIYTSLQKGGTTLKILVLVGFFIALIVSSIIVNAVQHMFMSFIGADVMYSNGKTKLFIIVMLAFLLFGLVGKLFGLG